MSRVVVVGSLNVDLHLLLERHILPGETLAEAIVTRSPKRRVIKRGKIVARDGVSIRVAP